MRRREAIAAVVAAITGKPLSGAQLSTALDVAQAVFDRAVIETQRTGVPGPPRR